MSRHVSHCLSWQMHWGPLTETSKLTGMLRAETGQHSLWSSHWQWRCRIEMMAVQLIMTRHNPDCLVTITEISDGVSKSTPAALSFGEGLNSTYSSALKTQIPRTEMFRKWDSWGKSPFRFANHQLPLVPSRRQVIETSFWKVLHTRPGSASSYRQGVLIILAGILVPIHTYTS